MKIGSTPTPPLPGLSGRPATASPPPRQEGNGFFGAIEGSRRNGYLEISICDLFKPIVETGTACFAVETSIGDDAVRFDARPIVAPAATAEAAAGHPAPAAPGTEAAALPDSPPRSALVELVGELAERIPVIAAQAAPPDHEVGQAAAAMRAKKDAISRSVGSALAMPVSPAARRVPTAAAGRTEAAALRYVPDQASASMRALAKVTALPRDIVVVLRGISLSAEESLALIGKMRGILVRHQLGDRTIRVVGREAGA